MVILFCIFITCIIGWHYFDWLFYPPQIWQNFCLITAIQALKICQIWAVVLVQLVGNKGVVLI